MCSVCHKLACITFPTKRLPDFYNNQSLQKAFGYSLRVVGTNRADAKYAKSCCHKTTCAIVLMTPNPLIGSLGLVSCPAPPHTCEEEGLVLWATFLVTASRFESLESDCRTRNFMRWHSNRAWDLVCLQCMGNAIIIHSLRCSTPPHVTRNVTQNTRPSFRFSGEGSGHETSLGCACIYIAARRLDYCTQQAVHSQRAARCGLHNSVKFSLCSLELNFSLFCDILGKWTWP